MKNFQQFLNTELITMKDVVITPYSLVEIFIIILIIKLLLVFAKKIIRMETKKRDLNIGDTMAIYQIIKYILITIGVIMILDSLGVNTTVLLTSSAALLVGVGLGIQDTFNDIISGLIILFGKIVRVNDVIQVGDLVGQVLEIRLRTTRIITRDDINMIVPNHKFTRENVVNYTLDFPHVRVQIDIGVAYGSNVEKVKEVLLKVADEHPLVLKNPPPFVRFNDFGDSSLDFQLFIWTNNVFRMENLKSDLRFQINQLFEKEDINIPFPQRTVWIKNDSK